MNPGDRFGHLVMLEQVSSGKHHKWRARCDCGAEKIVQKDNVTRGATRTCGCGVGRSARERFTRHSLAHRHPLYDVWAQMRNRCNNQRYRNYADYGARGIRVCARWDDFAAFVADMGERPPGTSIDRINNDGNYEPANCRWATHHEQANNRRPRRAFQPTEGN